MKEVFIVCALYANRQFRGALSSFPPSSLAPP